ncbi:MAG: NAD(+)/NADH kinase [Chloroflexi bacterium]|nr:NAD(+)/NADH kinase [Chloroflexota bacterium]
MYPFRTTIKMIGLVYNSQAPETVKMVAKLEKSVSLPKDHWKCAASELQEMNDVLPETSVIVVAGGDGTILRIVRVIAPHGIPMVGINMGRVGFMAELRVEEAVEMLPDYLEDGLRVEERMMLEATVVGPSESAPRLTLHALNDVVVGRGGVSGLLDIETTIDGVALTSYRADAVIVSTATGSTGYALSAGGPIMYPETRAMLIQPVAAHTGLSNGVILPDYSVIELHAGAAHEAVLSVDGFADMQLRPDDVVTIRRSPYITRFLRAHAPSTFYAALTRRLGLENL